MARSLRRECGLQAFAHCSARLLSGAVLDLLAVHADGRALVALLEAKRSAHFDLVLQLLGIDALAATWPRFRLPIKAGCGAMLVVACLTSFWEINQLVASSATQVSDETFRSDYMRLTNRDLQGYGVKPPAVVLFRYHPGGMLWSVPEFIQEPVYNVDVAWPDEAPIIRAHDLGPVRNREIFGYYAKTQPDRVFWSLDAARGNDALKRLGTARELAIEGEKP